MIDNARVELKMYKMMSASNVEKGTNMMLDFTEDKGHVWCRPRENRTGERWLRFMDLEKIAREDTVIIGYRREGRVKKSRIGTRGIREIMEQIRESGDVGDEHYCIGGRDLER